MFCLQTEIRTQASPTYDASYGNQNFENHVCKLPIAKFVHMVIYIGHVVCL